MNVATLALLLALIPAPASAPTSSPTPPHTIATVKSTPFCSSMVVHFNGAMRPLIANDFALDRVDDQLVDLKSVFDGPNYAQKYTTVRVKLIGLVGDIQKRLPGEQAEVNDLRDGEKLAADPVEAAKLHRLAEKMQQAYNHQFQLASDLLSLAQGMMEYDPLAGVHPLGGQDDQTRAMPDDMKDMKSYLKFDGQRDVIRTAESDAGDIAYDIATTNCR